MPYLLSLETKHPRTIEKESKDIYGRICTAATAAGIPNTPTPHPLPHEAGSASLLFPSAPWHAYDTQLPLLATWRLSTSSV